MVVVGVYNAVIALQYKLLSKSRTGLDSDASNTQPTHTVVERGIYQATRTSPTAHCICNSQVTTKEWA